MAVEQRVREDRIRFRLLGSLAAEADAGPVDLGPHKQRSVLAVLLLHANEIVPTDRIVDLVWGESPPRTADHSVQIYISDLRKALANGSPADLIETRPPGYVLNVPPESVDALRFQQLVRDGLAAVRTGDVAGGRPKLEKALDLWTAAPLADFAYEEFAQGFIRSLEELRSDALEALASVELDLGHLDEARDRARLAIGADPLREEPRRLMMLALYRSARQAEALRHFGEYRSVLAEELGIEPSAELRDLEERILLQDPGLAALPTTTAEGNPYRGLRAFSEEDADIYFGRERLVEEVIERLQFGSGFVSIVGPSGSGKSSAARAGVVPLVREAGDTVVVFQPGARPLWELAGAMDRAGFGSRAGLLRRFEAGADVLKTVVDRPVVLVVDQFEELFTLAGADSAVRFSELLARGILDHGTPLRVVATLRADYYDRPLSIPALAGVFSDSVVSVKPMTPLEVERAVVEPARAGGVSVEPALLAQLVADMGDEPGALPLLQVTLFELFERGGPRLTLSDYEGLGGLHGALTSGADELLDEFDDEGRELVEQVMMRMIQKGRALSTSRPVLLRDLLDLGVDNVVLQGVLEAFGSRRLITFDRDASGAAVVEIAHEYLIGEWPQLADWIERHSEDLDRLYALDSAANEWLGANSSDDYLLRGERLDRFKSWWESTTLRLTSAETAFLDSSIRLRDRLETERAEQEAEQRALSRKARFRLWAFGGAVAALAAAVTFLVMVLVPEPPPDVIVWYSGRGDGSFGDLIGNGIDLARTANPGLVISERFEPTLQHEEVTQTIGQGVPLVFWDSQRLEAWDPLPFIEEHPETQFFFIDCANDARAVFDLPPNAHCIWAGNDQMGFVAGVAAALATESGRVGFLGGLDFPVIWHFQAGFEQGVRFVDDSVEVDVIYLTTDWDFSAFSSTTFGEAGAEYLGRRGSDVIFNVAGFSGWGMFDWATQQQQPPWTIGVDVDQYFQIEAVSLFEDDEREAIRELMLTSVVKRLDLGIAEAISQYAESGSVDDVFVSIENGGIQFTTSGGHISPWMKQMDAAVEAVRNGEVTIDPENRSGTVLLFEELFR